jgi:hypothetical protein
MHLNHLIPTNTDFFIWDAVVAWRDYIFSKDFYSWSKGNYLTNMLKLIESNVVDVRLSLSKVNIDWLGECKNKVDEKKEWAKSTKTVRKTCLNSFYKFIEEVFDKSQTPYQRHPEGNEIEFILSLRKEDKHKHEKIENTVLKHVLSNVVEKKKARDISPIVLCNALSKINERDAYIVWLMMHTAQPLEKVLDLRKDNLKTSYMDSEFAIFYGLDPNEIHADMAYVYFDNASAHIPGHVVDGINKVCKNSKHFLFETVNGKRIVRTQVTRNLKQAGRNIGLDFDLTPKILYGYVCAYMTEDKRSILAKGLDLRNQ